MLPKKDPQRRIYIARNGILNIQGLPASTVRRQFRFEKADFGVLVQALKVPDRVTSAKGVWTAGAETLCTCLRHLACPNRLCDLQEYFRWHYSPLISSIPDKIMLRLAWLNLVQLKDMSEVNWASHLFHFVFIDR